MDPPTASRWSLDRCVCVHPPDKRGGVDVWADRGSPLTGLSTALRQDSSHCWHLPPPSSSPPPLYYPLSSSRSPNSSSSPLSSFFFPLQLSDRTSLSPPPFWLKSFPLSLSTALPYPPLSFLHWTGSFSFSTTLVRSLFLVLSRSTAGLSPGSHGNTGVGAAPGHQSELAATTRETNLPPYSPPSPLRFIHRLPPLCPRLTERPGCTLHPRTTLSAAISSLCLAAGEAEILAWEEILTGRAPHPWYHPTHLPPSLPSWNTSTISPGIFVGLRPFVAPTTPPSTLSAGQGCPVIRIGLCTRINSSRPPEFRSIRAKNARMDARSRRRKDLEKTRVAKLEFGLCRTMG